MNLSIAIKSIHFFGHNTPRKRKIKVRLINKSTITIESLYESWQQYGGTEKELWVTMPIANMFNDWLHGSEEL